MDGSGGSLAASGGSGSALATDPGESVEWVNMCWRKVWRVYQRGLERWIIDLLQPVFDGLVKDGSVPRWLCRLRVVELTLDHEAPYFSNMRRRNSRKDSDLNGVVDLRYTGGARMLLLLELGEGRWRFKVPVLVSDLDLECQMWLKLRLAPMCPWIGTISLAFVGPPNVKVQLSPYNRVRLMRVPVVQNYLRKLLTVDLPALMVLPQRLEINIPPSVTTIAEAAVGRDTIMRAVASAVLQADAVEAALLAALPLGPQTPAGGVTLPEAFKGELSVALREARNLPVWGFPGQSNPYCRLVLGDQAVQSRREGDTSHPGRHRAPVWNQEFQFLVLEMLVKDSHLTGRTEVGRASIKLVELLAAQSCAEGGKVSMWVPLQPPAASYGITGGEAVPTGEVLVELSYKPFDDDEADSGCREAENYSKQAAAQAPITDIRSAAAASSRAAVAASAAVSAIAMTKAAAARAAARAARAAQEAAAVAAGAAKGAVDQGASIIGGVAGADAQSKAAAAALPQPREQRQLTAGGGSVTTSAGDEAAVPLRGADSVAEAITAGQRGSGGSGSGAYVVEAGAPVVNGTAVHLAPAETSPQAARVFVVAGSDDGGGDDGQGGGGTTLQTRALARASALAAATSAAAAASTAAARSAAAATAVLERPVPSSLREEGGASLGGNGHAGPPHGGGGSPSPGGGQASWREAGDGDVADARSGGREGEDASAMGHQVSASWRSETNGHSNGNGVNGAEPSHTAATALPPQHVVRVRVSELPKQPRGLSASSLPPRSSRSDGSSASVDVFDVTAELLTLEAPPPEGPAAPGDRPTDQSGVAAGGPMLSALASWTASAQSLTASALDKARESFGQKGGKEATKQHGGSGGAAVDGDGATGGSSGEDWLRAIVSRLPRYGGQHHDDGGADGAATGPAEASRAGLLSKVPTGEEEEDHPWWHFWVPKGGAAKLRDVPAADAEGAAPEAAEPSSASGGAGGDGEQALARPWWQFWPDGDKDKDRVKRQVAGEADGEGEGGEGDGSKPVEAIIIPPDLPLEEIAAEVARLKEDSWRERSDHVSNLWVKAVERNDRKWLMLAAFLLSVAVGLLTVVAWRLEQLEQLEQLHAAAPQVALMSMQAALQALLQHAADAGGSGSGLP
ncbi:hypothetical protein GPECTOR_17g864 [Gonium pectorale]|uniref:C2 domain-containing protein n=1 Tax=Gonium pectorale TaxID=33097 RepID=A0A150GKB5_GONPE|nr:hypothetical protein GPECTOR_17g864 [Gonium pectorale]|eukprot:KXZ50227.1 hypothetical protein GPECTOR_17g864 [Gonium pectorale]